MTRYKHTHTGLVTPQLPQLWLTAVLRVFAMLVSSVCSTLPMIRRPARVNATRATPPGLPREKTDTDQETHAVQPDSPKALMLSSAQSARPSKHKRVLATLSHTSPSPSVSHAARAIHLPLLRMGRTKGTSSTAFGGGGGSPRLRGETEGVRRDPHSGRIGPVGPFEQRTPARKRGPGRPGSAPT